MEVWIGRDGERHGPYQESDIRAWLRSGQVSPQDLGWYEGLADWQPLASLFPEVTAQQAAGGTAPPAFAAAAPLPLTNAASLEDHAGFWKRVAAWILDTLVLLIPDCFVYDKMGVIDAFSHSQYMVQLKSGVAPSEQAMAALRSAVLLPFVIVIAIGFVYYVLLESSKWQATLGKLALGIRVTDVQGKAPGFVRCIVRNAVRLLSAVPLPMVGLLPLVAYLTTAWSPRKQGLHDMVAKTLVLNGRASEFKNAASPTRNPGRGPDGSFNA